MSTNQFSTFLIDDRLYGVNIRVVQEITKSMAVTEVPLSPGHIKGLINLRGQIATAVGLRELFEINASEKENGKINVVCKSEAYLLSLVVDEVGDVLELDDILFDPTPETVSLGVSKFMSGVYKLPDNLLSVIDIQKIIDFLNV
jgi:purine-binding chemotaxis protein CheW